ncbi:MAG: response regulator transcription factor [Ruminococcaceae bacterium]|nr:response regulator transcription factor [Oscillospiraceae bacterium]
MFNILVVEDDASARLLMCEVLRGAGYTPWPAGDGLEALEVMDHQQIDLAIVDVMMPRMDGYAFTRTLREGNSDLPVLMVTARVTQEDKRKGFQSGTDDYMVKPVDEEEMLWRITALLRRYRSATEHRLTVGSTVLDYNAFQVTGPGGTEQLTAKEFLLLYKLLSYPSTLFTKRQLIDELWNMDSDVDEHTVEVYVSRLREKFRDNPDFELRTIRGFGYMGMLKEESHA